MCCATLEPRPPFRAYLAFHVQVRDLAINKFAGSAYFPCSTPYRFCLSASIRRYLPQTYSVHYTSVSQADSEFHACVSKRLTPYYSRQQRHKRQDTDGILTHGTIECLSHFSLADIVRMQGTPFVRKAYGDVPRSKYSEIAWHYVGLDVNVSVIIYTRMSSQLQTSTRLSAMVPPQPTGPRTTAREPRSFRDAVPDPGSDFRAICIFSFCCSRAIQPGLSRLLWPSRQPHDSDIDRRLRGFRN